MSDHSLAVEIRKQTGKGVARKLRAAGRAPAVLYGHGNQPVSLSFDPHTLESVLKTSEAGLNTLIDLQGAGEISGKTVLVKELQRDPVRNTVLHADLFEVDPDQTIVVSVPVQIEGTATGVTLGGGLLDHVMREIELECLPGSIPDVIRLDVSALELGESLHVRDLDLPKGASLRSDGDLSIVSVVAPAAAEVEEQTEVEEAVEAAADGEAKPEAESGGKSD